MSIDEVSKREKCLETAKEYVTKDRSSTYGTPEDNFANIAEIWNAQGVTIDGRQLVASDVALLMAGMKLARLRFNPNHDDSWIDLAGYAACGMETAHSQYEDRPGAFSDVEDAPSDWKIIEKTAQPDDKVTLSDLPDVWGMPGWKLIGQTSDDGFVFGAPIDTPLPPPFKLPVDDAHVRETVLSGWNSDNRCRVANEHAAHPYGPVNQHWCDGYTESDSQVQLKKDIETIKNVADKANAKFGALKPKPIKDNPQA